MIKCRKLICLTLLLATLAACGGNEPAETTAETTAGTTAGTTAETTAGTTFSLSISTTVPSDAAYIDCETSDGSWLTLTVGYTDGRTNIALTAELDGASFLATAGEGSLFVGESRESAASAVEFSSGDLISWRNGDWQGEETFVDVVAFKDGYIVGYGSVLIRDRAAVEFDLIDPGKGFAAEIVSCTELPKLSGRYQELPLAQAEDALTAVHTSAAPLEMVNLYYEWTGYRFYNSLLSSGITGEVCIALTSDDPEVTFRARATNGDISYAAPKNRGVYADVDVYTEMTAAPKTTLSWRPNSSVEISGTTCYVEITIYKNGDIIGYSLVRIGQGSTELYGRQNLLGSIVAYTELDQPITESELETVFTGLKEQNP